MNFRHFLKLSKFYCSDNFANLSEMNLFYAFYFHQNSCELNQKNTKNAIFCTLHKISVSMILFSFQ